MLAGVRFECLPVPSVATKIRLERPCVVTASRRWRDWPLTTHLNVDLEPYCGRERGVSRIHAVIRRAEDGFMVEDLMSSNGTWLNGTALRPFTPRRLKSGDRLRLGLLEITVYFR